MSLPHFTPHFWLPNGHLQTIAGAYLPGAHFPYRAEQHVVELDDGDCVVLHDDFPDDWQPTDRSVLLLHGLGGSATSDCIARTAGKLNERGIRTFRLDQRGCGASASLARRPAHAGRSEDVIAALMFLAELCPDSPVTLVGYSLGGNITLKTLGEVGTLPPGNLDSGAAVCPPVDLVASSEHIYSGWNWIYDSYFTQTCVRHVAARRKSCPVAAGVRFSPLPWRLVDFDHRVTAPLSGYASVTEYYHAASSWPLLHRIALPTYILAAADDPAVPVEPLRTATLSPSITLHVTDHGGHLGYIAAPGSDPDLRWMEWRIVEWVERIVARPSQAVLQR
jgi:predicted alpha/beta-fold hydrolase